MTGFRLREVNYSSNTRKGLKSYLLSDGRCFPEVDSIHVGKQIFSMFVKGCHLTVCLWDLQSIWIYYQPHPPHPYSSGSFQRKYPQTPFSPCAGDYPNWLSPQIREWVHYSCCLLIIVIMMV